MAIRYGQIAVGVALAVLITGLLSFLHPERTYGCEPIPIGSPLEELERFDSVFLGEATSAEPLDRGYEYKETIYEFIVTTVWKGPLAEKRMIRTRDSESICGRKFQIGQEYVVYSYDGEEDSLHSRTRLIAEAAEDLAELGEGDTPIPGTLFPPLELESEPEEEEKPASAPSTPTPTPEAGTEQPTKETPTPRPTPEVGTEQPTKETPTPRPTPEVGTEQPTKETPTPRSTPEAGTEQPTKETPTPRPTPEVGTEQPTKETPTPIPSTSTYMATAPTPTPTTPAPTLAQDSGGGCGISPSRTDLSIAGLIVGIVGLSLGRRRFNAPR